VPPEGDPEDPEGTRAAIRMLRETGWTVVEVSAGDALPELWQQADRYRSQEESQQRDRREAGARA
jgi:hypothetical protein